MRIKDTIATTLILGLLLTPQTATASNRIKMGFAEATPGANEVPVIVTAENDLPIHGYSLAFTYPVPELRLANLPIAGTNVGVMEPDFVAPTFDNGLGIGSLGVIFSFAEPFALDELPASEDGAAPRIIARITFDVRSFAKGGIYKLALQDGIGTPASFNRFTSAGSTIVPELEDGTFVISGGNVLALEKKVAFPGASPNLRIHALARHAQPLDGFQIAFRYEKAGLVLKDSSFSTTSLFFELGANGIESFNFDLDENFSSTYARATAAALFDSSPPFDGQALSPSVDEPLTQTLVRYTFDVKAEASSEKQFQDLVLEDVNIPGAIDNRFFIDANSVDPRLQSGKIYFSTGGLTGRLLNAETGEGVSGAQIVTDPDGVNVVTNSAGIYSFDSSALPAGWYDLKFAKRGFYSTRKAQFLVNGNGEIEDAGDTLIYSIPRTPPKPFVRGYVNRDKRLDLSDGIAALNFLFQGAGRVDCLMAADVNDDNKVDISDGVFLLNYLFIGGQRPKEPFSLQKTGCAVDPTPGGELTCEEFECLDE